MRQRVKSVLAYAGAALTLTLAVLTPFVLSGFFSDAVAHAGLHIDSMYAGGSIARTISKQNYRIDIYHPVRPHMFQGWDAFVQVAWVPASTLPAQVSDDLDLDGDGYADARISLAVPSNPQIPVQGQVVALNARFQPVTDVRQQSFSKLIVRTGDKILVRIPLSRHEAQ